MVAIFTCQILFSFPSSGNVWRCQHFFLLRAKHTCGGNAGCTSLHVVISAGWFQQRKDTHNTFFSEEQLNCQKATHGLPGLFTCMLRSLVDGLFL